MSKLYYTKDYSIFQFDFNRNISQFHVDLIASSPDLEESLRFHPCVVNENNLIIDGQHRIKAAEKMGVGVYYFIKHGATVDDIKECNIKQRSWTPKDFIDFYAKQEKKTYLIIKDLVEKNGLPLFLVTKICQIFGSSGRRFDFSKQIKNGELTLKNVDKVYEFTEIYSNLIKHMTREKGCHSVKYLLNDKMCSGYIHFFKNETKKFDTIVKKTPDQYKKLCRVHNQQEAVDVLEKIRTAK